MKETYFADETARRFPGRVGQIFFDTVSEGNLRFHIRDREKRVQSNESFWMIRIRWDDEAKDWICPASGKFGWDIFSSVRFHYQSGTFTLIRITTPKPITSLYSSKTHCIFVRGMHAEKNKKSARGWTYCDKNLEILDIPCLIRLEDIRLSLNLYADGECPTISLSSRSASPQKAQQSGTF